MGGIPSLISLLIVPHHQDGSVQEADIAEQQEQFEQVVEVLTNISGTGNENRQALMQAGKYIHCFH